MSRAGSHGGRHRPTLWLGAAGVVAFGVFLLGQLTLAVSKAGELGDLAVPITVVVVLGVAAISILGVVVGVQRQRYRLRALRSRYPEDLVLPMIQPHRLTVTLRWLGYDGPRLGNYFVVRVDPEGVTFWKGSREPELRFRVGATRIRGVGVGSAIVSRPIAVVELTVHDAAGEAVLVQLAPSLEGWRLPFAQLNGAATHSTAEKIRAALGEV